MCFPKGFAGVMAGLVGLAGCHGPDPKTEPFGKTYYIDGAGNWGFGVAEVTGGLRKAGYQGDIETYSWSMTLNPLIDQLNLFGVVRGTGRQLAERIKAYKRCYPNNTVNIIALSAGTGVAVWACEFLDENARVDNLVLLGSSLSYDYDMSKALPHIKNRVYVYYSPHDAILGTCGLFGTIDRKIGIKCAGQVGLQPAGGNDPRIVNQPWSQEWQQLGWRGGHTDCTNERFVQYEIAPRIVTTSAYSYLIWLDRGQTISNVDIL